MSATKTVKNWTARRSNKVFEKLAKKRGRAPKTGVKGGQLAYDLFDNNIDVANLALDTKFIQGIKTGLLDPTEYGGYTVQDAIYCWHSTKNLRILEQKAASEGLTDLENFAMLKAESYKEYTDSMFQDWHINNPTGIDLGEAAKNYLEFSHSVLSGFPPYYMIIAMLPCDMLWEWLGQQLKGDISATNVYSFWIEGNLPGSTSWEDFVDDHTDKYDRDIANQIFRIGMISELNFFRSGCGEELEPVPELPNPPSAPR